MIASCTYFRCEKKYFSRQHEPVKRSILGNTNRRFIIKPILRSFQANAVQKNYFELLQLSSNATESDVKAAFRRNVLKYHPDVNKSPEASTQFQNLKLAYETLSDPKRRADYELTLGLQGYRRENWSPSSWREQDKQSSGKTANVNDDDDFLGLGFLFHEIAREVSEWMNEEMRTEKEGTLHDTSDSTDKNSSWQSSYVDFKSKYSTFGKKWMEGKVSGRKKSQNDKTLWEELFGEDDDDTQGRKGSEGKSRKSDGDRS